MFPKCLILGMAGMFLMQAAARSQDTPSDSASMEERFPNLVQLVPPAKGEKVQESTIYIDSVRYLSEAARPTLVIHGHLPDGCTHIGSAGHEKSKADLALRLKAWREPDRLCTQALVPFSFLYRALPDEFSLSDYRRVIVNGNSYELQVNPN
ncbi:MAG: hypothetical protein R3224_01330 [Balneolaceae bacterium]|nr:hypothetical protein [Balneolaceae bacterium]